MNFVCEHCRRQFSRESTLSVHMCEPKRRRQEQNERGVQLGFYAFLRFYELTQGSSRLRTFDDFAASPYYRAMVRFGRYCVDTRAIEPERFLEWLLNKHKKVDRWATDQNYTDYLVEHLYTEKPDAALARAIEFGLDWAEKHHAQANDCLRYGNSNMLCYSVSTGRISAWVLYNCESGRKFLSELDTGQIGMIWPYVDTDRWNRRFGDYAADRAWVAEMLSQAGW